MTIEIERGIPMPQPKARRYPWNEMEVGDSFFVPESNAKANSIVQLVGRVNRKSDGKRFIYCEMDGGVRVWREQ